MPPTSQGAITIVIADDHSIYRNGFCAMLSAQQHIIIIGQAGDGKELLEVVGDKKPDVVLTDIRMPLMDGIEATRCIKQRYPLTEVIALSLFDDEHSVWQMMQAGAKGYLLKNTDEREAVQAIRTVQQQGTYYCTTVSNKLLGLMCRGHHPLCPSGKELRLSDKELAIMQLICQQYSNKEIGCRLKLSCRTVESSRERIQEKTGARNMVGIALYAIKHGIFKPE